MGNQLPLLKPKSFFSSKKLKTAIPSKSLFKYVQPTVSFMSYNILADCYVEPSYFPYVDKQNLDIRFRAPKIVSQIHDLSPDVFVLQEADHFENLYQEVFAQQDVYTVMYFQRPGRSDGLLFGWKKNMFEYLTHHKLDFDQIAKQLKYNATYLKQVIAVSLELQNKQLNRKQVFVGTHLFWDPRNEYVKYHEMLSIVSFINDQYPLKEQQVFFGGDFNSLPQSNQVSYLLQKTKPVLHTFELNQEQQLKIELLEYKMHKGKNIIKWGNAYQNYEGEDVYPKYTTYTHKWNGTIDHIFYRLDCGIKPLRVLNLPDLQDVVCEVALPNTVYGSDHLALMCEFEV